MKILTTNKELNLQETYNLTMAPDARKMKEYAGSEIEIAAWAIYEDVDKSTGELHQILAIQDPDGEVYGTNSSTFMEELTKMEELANQFGQTVTAVTVIMGSSKKGREFVTCKMARAEASENRLTYHNESPAVTPAAE